MHILNRFSLRTPESVELEFTLAGIGNRALALCIDYPLWLLIMTVGIFLWSFVSEQLIRLLVEWSGDADSVDLWLGAIALLIFFSIYVGYFVWFETLWQGQTPGKRIAKIRVIRNDGRPVGLAQSTLRALLRPIDDFPFLGIIGGALIFITAREKRLGDFMAGTLVVVDEQSVKTSAVEVSEQASAVASILSQSADVSRLLPDDFAIVRDYLQRRHGMVADAQRAVCVRLTQEVRERIQMAELPDSISPDVFLEAVYLVYQNQSSF
ncbi:MAG: RDD family protein [Cyanobacteria bacterium P01_E01_bin.6]